MMTSLEPRPSNQTPARTRRGELMLVALVLLLAFGLRMATLERKPLHFDEGNSVFFARYPLPQLLQASIENREADPPGYRLTLGLWIGLAGPTPLSIRLYSVFYGILAVAVLYTLLRLMRLPVTASLIAVLILAGSAFAIDYSQQAKGYAMGAAMGLVSWWTWTSKVLAHGRRHRVRLAFAVYVASTLLMISTHYYTVALLGMEWLWFVGYRVLGRRATDVTHSRMRIAAIGFAGQLLALLPIALWTILAIRGILGGARGLSNTMRASGPWTLGGRILAEMSAGQFADPLLALSGAMLFSLCAGFGAIQLWRRGYRSAFWFGVSALVPAAGALVLQQRVTFFYPRFLLYVMPCMCVLIAGCALNRQRLGAMEQAHAAHAVRSLGGNAIGGLSFMGLVVLGVVIAVSNFAYRPTPADDYRGLIAAMRPLIKQNDAALGSFIWMEGMLTSYAPETRRLLYWYSDFYSPENVVMLMQPIARRHRRIWSFNYQRNPDARETLSVLWLKSHCAYAGRFNAGTLSVLLFDTMAPEPASAGQGHAQFGRSIQLRYPRLQTNARTGDTVPMALVWSTSQPITENLTVFLHLSETSGKLVAQNDSAAVNGLAPSFTWQANRPVIDQRALLIPDGLAPGDYAVDVGLYRLDNGTRLSTDSGADSVRIGTVTVQ